MADEDPLDSSMPDEEYSVEKAPKSARAWLAAIKEAQAAFKGYQDRCDGIDRLYADLDKLANSARDRQFQMFWANVQVLGPSVYSRPPVPVVVPRFRDQRALPRQTSELLERATAVSFEIGDVDSVMRLLRDDMIINARGAAWVRYETKADSDTETERVCYEHVDRGDFLHPPARKWAEVDWVGKRSWLTKKEMRKRFSKESGDEYKKASYTRRKDDDGADDGKEKAGVWEIWCKSQDKVIWVAEGCEKLLDDDKPHLKLEGFFPCPRPAYGTLQRRSLIPVPDMVQYKDQLEEINELTARIAALSEAVKVRGFYPAGAGEIGDAIEAAIKSVSDNAVLIPVSSWAGLGGAAPKDTIVWLPLEMIATVIAQLVELRKQLIDDVYQITGLSDIMRGSTEASETLGAQQLKSQYGSIRIRDRQDELVRVARDLTRIGAEIMAENFDKKTLLDMTQMDLPSDADVAKRAKAMTDQARDIERQIAQAAKDPEIMKLAQANPDKAQQAMQQARQQAQQLMQQAERMKDETVTIDKAMGLLKDQRLRPFILDVETDSTIAPDENAQKQRATEYLTAMGGLLQQAVPAIQALPPIAPLVADTIKFAQSQFRVGRQLDQSVEEFTEVMKQIGKQPPPDPNHANKAADEAGAQAAQQKAQMDAQAHQADMQSKQIDGQIRIQEAQQKAQAEQQRLQADLVNKQAEGERAASEAAIRAQGMQADQAASAQKHAQAMELGALQIEKLRLEIDGVKVKTDATIASTNASIDAKQRQTDAGIAATAAKTEARERVDAG